MKPKAVSALALAALLSLTGFIGCSSTQLQGLDEGAPLVAPPEPAPRQQSLGFIAPRPSAEAEPAREIVLPMIWIAGLRPQAAKPDAAAALAEDFAAFESPASPRAPSHRQLVTLERNGDATLSPVSVARVLSFAHEEARACYLRAVASDAGQGRADVDFVIDRSGEVDTVRVRARDISDNRVVPCIANSYFRLRFAPPSAKFVEVRDAVTVHG
jgi:hypothetical protein